MKENDFLFWLSGFLLEKKELLPSEVETVKEETHKAIQAIVNKSKPIGFKQYENYEQVLPEEESMCPCDIRRGGSGICNCTLGPNRTTTRLNLPDGNS